MKTGKPSGTDVKNAASVAGGAIVGSWASNGIFAGIHDEKKVISDADEKKSHDNMGLLKRGGLAVAGVLAASAIKSTDVPSLLVKGVCYGIAGQQGYEIVKSIGSKNESVKKMAESKNKAERAIAAAFGLGCACDSQKVHYAQLNGRRRKRSGMGMPVMALHQDFADVNRIGVSGNVFEQAQENGSMAVSY